MALETQKLGFSNVSVLRGGYNGWIKSGYETEEKPSLKLACISCHTEATPNIVVDWKASKHSSNDVTCSVCHGIQHSSKDDIHRLKTVTPYICAKCHEDQGVQFKRSKHALAWDSAKLWPTAHWQGMIPIEGRFGCQRCHKIGTKSKAEIKALKRRTQSSGIISCDLCHTGHVFSAGEARQAEACRNCHQGSENPQWEAYTGSVHGSPSTSLASSVDRSKSGARLPVCQDCHMPGGSHEVNTAWGSLAIRWPLPMDEEWAAAIKTILTVMYMVDPQGNDAMRLESARRQAFFQLDQERWEKERQRMIGSCNKCHARKFVEKEMRKADKIVRYADIRVAEAIGIVKALDKREPISEDAHTNSLPLDLLFLNNSIEPKKKRLYSMFFQNRKRAIHGAFHSNLEYGFVAGVQALQSDLDHIKFLATTSHSGIE